MKSGRGRAHICIAALVLFSLVGIGLVVSEDITIIGDGGAIKINDSAIVSSIEQMSSSNISDVEKEGILYMAEEEKLAEDTYTTLNKRWNLRVFANIGSAEGTHVAAVRTLISRYALKDPTTGDIGAFSNPQLQKAYNELVSKGDKSLKNALEVGAEIEEMDILDLQQRIGQTDKADIKLVYDNLMRGSRNHLRAFVSNLGRDGYKYSPQHLNQQAYNDIINSKT